MGGGGSCLVKQLWNQIIFFVTSLRISKWQYDDRRMCMLIASWLAWYSKIWPLFPINPIRVGGGLNQPALFSDGYFSMKKGVWRSQISWLFLIHYELSEKQKKIFGFSQCFGVIQPPPPPLSSNIQEPCPIRVKLPPWPKIMKISPYMEEVKKFSRWKNFQNFFCSKWAKKPKKTTCFFFF